MECWESRVITRAVIGSWAWVGIVGDCRYYNSSLLLFCSFFFF